MKHDLLLTTTLIFTGTVLGLLSPVIPKQTALYASSIAVFLTALATLYFLIRAQHRRSYYSLSLLGAALVIGGVDAWLGIPYGGYAFNPVLGDLNVTALYLSGVTLVATATWWYASHLDTMTQRVTLATVLYAAFSFTASSVGSALGAWTYINTLGALVGGVVAGAVYAAVADTTQPSIPVQTIHPVSLILGVGTGVSAAHTLYVPLFISFGLSMLHVVSAFHVE